MQLSKALITTYQIIPSFILIYRTLPFSLSLSLLRKRIGVYLREGELPVELNRKKKWREWFKKVSEAHLLLAGQNDKALCNSKKFTCWCRNFLSLEIFKIWHEIINALLSFKNLFFLSNSHGYDNRLLGLGFKRI